MASSVPPVAQPEVFVTYILVASVAARDKVTVVDVVKLAPPAMEIDGEVGAILSWIMEFE